MLIPISWLRDYVDVPADVDELAETLTLAGLEVAAVRRVGDWWAPETLVVGRVVAVAPHPDADRLVLVDVEHGAGGDGEDGGIQRVVTGAPNLFQYRGADDLPVLKIAFARQGAVLVDAYSDRRPRPRKKLKPAKIRGVRSAGMVCSELELGLSEEHEGILVLPEDAPVGTPLKDYLGDAVLDIDLSPDLARCLSVVGVAREVAALTGAALRPPTAGEKVREGAEAASLVEVEIDDPALCNRFTAHLVRGVTVGPSPEWIRRRLLRAGVSAINNVVDVTNYVMLELGQPMHAYDYDRLLERARASGRERPLIRVRTARPGERLTTLDGKERGVEETMLMISDSQGLVGIGGVMGAENTEVHAGTTNVLLEAATFDQVSTRRTAQALKLHTEASSRFTRGVPATLNLEAARRGVDLICATAGGEAVPGAVDVYPVPQAERTAYLTASEVRRQLGMEVALEEMESALAKLDFRTERLPGLPAPAAELGDAAFGLAVADGEPVLAATAPWYRLDVELPADLTEEVARIIGYDRVPETLLASTLPRHAADPAVVLEERVRDVLVACGLQETINYTLTTEELHAALGAAPEDPRRGYVRVTNTLSEYRRVMRRTLLVSALENAAANLRHTDRLLTFEVGRVYLPEAGEAPRPLEERRLSLLLTGSRRQPGLHADPAGGEDLDFFDLKGACETLFDRLGVAGEVTYELATEPYPFGPRCAEVRLGDEHLGRIGELHPRALAAFDLAERRVAAAELRLDPLVRPPWKREPVPAFSDYPPLVEDLAFLVRDEVTARQVADAIGGAGVAILERLELFDLYRGDPLPAGHKSLAFRLTYRSPDSTLKTEDVARARSRIEKAVAEAVAGELRS